MFSLMEKTVPVVSVPHLFSSCPLVCDIACLRSYFFPIWELEKVHLLPWLSHFIPSFRIGSVEDIFPAVWCPVLLESNSIKNSIIP
jgi:hypothetical protein